MYIWLHIHISSAAKNHRHVSKDEKKKTPMKPMCTYARVHSTTFLWAFVYIYMLSIYIYTKISSSYVSCSTDRPSTWKFYQEWSKTTLYVWSIRSMPNIYIWGPWFLTWDQMFFQINSSVNINIKYLLKKKKYYWRKKNSFIIVFFSWNYPFLIFLFEKYFQRE